MKLPPLSALRAFEATARLASFSKAGDELFVTHAAISHQIKKLEEWLGSPLFVRRGRKRGIALTRSGDMLYRHLSPALGEIADACARVKAVGGRDVLTVGCIPSIASRWLVPNLRAFARANPNLDVRVVYASAAEKIGNGELDVLITNGEDSASDVISTRLFSRLTKPVCSPAFWREHGPFDDAATLASVPLLHDEDRNDWRQWFQAASAAPPAEDNWPIYQDFNLLATAMVAGHGAALCPVDVFQLEIDRGDLIVLSDIAINLDAAYYATHRVQAKPSIVDFVDWLGTFV